MPKLRSFAFDLPITRGADLHCIASVAESLRHSAGMFLDLTYGGYFKYDTNTVRIRLLVLRVDLVISFLTSLPDVTYFKQYY